MTYTVSIRIESNEGTTRIPTERNVPAERVAELRTWARQMTPAGGTAHVQVK